MSPPRETADLIVSAAAMLTPDLRVAENQAVAVRGGEIVAVGPIRSQRAGHRRAAPRVDRPGHVRRGRNLPGHRP